MLLAAPGAILLVWLLFVFYAAVMNLYRAYTDKKMDWPLKVVAYPTLAVGAALDAAVNILVCTLLFIEVPKEWLVTSRLARLKKTEGWRSKVASWVCTHILDPLDPSGCHCK